GPAGGGGCGGGAARERARPCGDRGAADGARVRDGGGVRGEQSRFYCRGGPEGGQERRWPERRRAWLGSLFPVYRAERGPGRGGDRVRLDRRVCHSCGRGGGGRGRALAGGGAAHRPPPPHGPGGRRGDVRGARRAVGARRVGRVASTGGGRR